MAVYNVCRNKNETELKQGNPRLTIQETERTRSSTDSLRITTESNFIMEESGTVRCVWSYTKFLLQNFKMLHSERRA